MKPRNIPFLRHATFTFAVCGLLLPASATTFDVPAGTTQQLATVLEIGEGLVKTGDGTLAVTIDQFINDDVVVNGGTLIFYGAADPEETSPSMTVNAGTLMLGGDASSVPVTLNGGTLVIGSQRSIPWTSITDGRRLIATQGGNADFNFAGTATFYTAGRAANQSQPQEVIDLGIPESGLITSLADPTRAYQFRIASAGVNCSRVNSHEGGANGANTKYIGVPADHQLKYVQVQTLLATSAGTSMNFAGYARYTDAPTSGFSIGTSTGIPLYTAAAANPVLSVGGYDRGTQTYSTNLLSFHDHTYLVNPEKNLSAVGLLRSGNNTNTGGYFALSGLAINEAAFTSDLTVTADSLLDLAGAPIIEAQARLGAAGLILNDARLTITRSINNATTHRTSFTGGTFTGEAWIETANSTGGGAGSVVITGPVGGTGGLVKSGPGNLGLGGGNSFSGPSELLAGTIWLNSVTGLGSAAAGTTLEGGTLYLLNGSHTAPIAEPLTVTGAATLRSGNGFSYTLSGPIVLNSDLTVTLDGGTTITCSGPVSGTATIDKNNGETLVLSGNNSFGSGTMSLGSGTTNRGYIRLESNTALGNHDVIALIGTQGGVSGIQLAGDVTIPQNLTTRGRQNASTTGYALRSLSGNNTWNGNITVTDSGGGYGIICDAGSLTLNGTLSSNVASNALGARLYSFTGAGDIVVAGNLSKGGEFTMQNLNVTKDGSGTLTLAGTNDYSGSTNLNNGTTVLSGSIAGSAVVTINSAATLDVTSHAPAGYAFGTTQTLRGTGKLLGKASTAGIVAPGIAAGTLTVDGDFTFEAGSTYSAEIDILGTAQVETATAAGTAAADGNVAVTVTGAGIAGSPVALSVPILNGETPAAWAVKVRTALAANPAVTSLYAVGGINEQITLTRLSGAANDATLNIALADGDPSPGITAAPTSANTTAGVAPGHDTLAVSGNLEVSGATLDLVVTGTPTAPAYVIATYGSRTGNFAAVNNLPGGYTIDYAYNSGTAIALVSGAPADNYDSWAAANGIAGQPFGGDFDSDGLSNGLEYAIAGLNPAGPDGSPGSFTSGTLSFTKRPEAVANGDVSYAIETSSTLAAGSWTTVTPDVNNSTTISYTLPTGQGRIFARLVVTRTP